MKTLLTLFFLSFVNILHAQAPADTLSEVETIAAGDDPSQFFTRVEFFNELQHHQNNGADFYLNETTLRTIVKIGRRFTTRLDIPFVYNSYTAAGYQQFGLSDISFRLLGYKFFQTNKSAFTASAEISLNTAQSPLVGSGKNIIFPVVSYTTRLKEERMLLAFVFQEGITMSGDKERDNVNYSHLRGILLYIWTKNMWTILEPELYVDYLHGGASMNLKEKITYAPAKRINVWAQTGIGLFGDYIARYQWKAEVGCRYFFLRNTILKRKNK